MAIDVRTIGDDEVVEWVAAVGRGFLQHRSDLVAEAEARRPAMDLSRIFAAFDGERIVATLRSFRTDLTVPGGVDVPTSAVTGVTTTSTHRRQGLAKAMVTRDLRDAAERGEQAAVLIAAEWGIYGRFGFGPSTEHQTLTLRTPGAALRHRPLGRVEFVDRDTARAMAPEIYEKHRLEQPGELNWPPRSWDIDYGIVRYEGVDASPSFHVIARDQHDEPIGYGRYRYQDAWQNRQANGRMDVGALIGSTVEGQALLWQHMIEHDLTTSVVAADRSAADLLPMMLDDPRHVTPSDRADFLWLRPLDPVALLAARTYGTPGRLVLEVVDPMGIAAGRFALEAEEGGATCVPTTEAADVTMPVASLGSLYLGGHHVRARVLSDIGLIDEHSPGAVAKADVMFSSLISPWSSTWF